MYYKVDLSKILKVILLEKDRLIPPRMHYTRTVFEYSMYVILSGRLELDVNGERVVLTKGDVRFFDKDVYQRAIRAELCEYYYIHFYSSGVSRLDISEDKFCALVREKEENFKKMEFYKEECYDNMCVYIPEQIHIESQSLFEYIVNTLKSNTLTPITSGTKMVESRFDVSAAVAKIFFKLEKANSLDSDKSVNITRKIANFIDQNYFRPMTGEDIEKEFYISFDYANRVFKKGMGVSIMRYRNDVRLGHAKALLLATELPLSKIAAQVGFENSHYFSRIFKKEEGVSPSEYKNNFFKKSIGERYE